MSIPRLQNEMRLQALRASGGFARGRWGLVDAYDPNAYAVKVQFLPEDRITGWLPIQTLWSGSGFGLQFGPAVGDMAYVEFADGDPEAGTCIGFGFNDVERPLPVPSGEAWLTHQTGSFLRLHNDGSVELHTAADLKATVAGNLTATVAGSATGTAASWTLNGPTTVNGNLSVNGGIAAAAGAGGGGGGITASGPIQSTGSITSTGGDVVAGGVSLKNHTHSDPQGGTTGKPQ